MMGVTSRFVAEIDSTSRPAAIVRWYHRHQDFFDLVIFTLVAAAISAALLMLWAWRQDSVDSHNPNLTTHPAALISCHDGVCLIPPATTWRRP